MSQILVVSNDCIGLAHTLRVLNDAGHRATGVSTFEEATRLLDYGAPDLVIADERLGTFNGLHVILRARAEHPYMSAILISPRENRGIEADARSLNVRCMVKPQNAAQWMAAISGTLQVDRIARLPVSDEAMYAVQHSLARSRSLFSHVSSQGLPQ